MINTNLKFWRRELAITQAQMADRLGIKRSLVGAYEEGRAEPRLSTLVNMARLFGISLDQLVTTDFTKKKNAKAAASMRNFAPLTESGDTSDDPHDPQPAGGKLRILALTVDREQNENIEWIPQKAAAGYLNGYADPEYLEVLPKFRLPMLPATGTYRAFEISGDSMLPHCQRHGYRGPLRGRVEQPARRNPVRGGEQPRRHCVQAGFQQAEK